MLETIKKYREEKGEDGFTLAELLVVVAIIMVLVAIAIPVFSGALDSANTATAKADIRAVQAAASTKYLLDGETAATQNYSATIDAAGNVTNVTKTTDAATSEAEVIEQIQDDEADTLNIVVTVVETDLTN